MVTVDSLWTRSSPYPTPTPYDLPFSHNTCVTDRQRNDILWVPKIVRTKCVSNSRQKRRRSYLTVIE